MFKANSKYQTTQQRQVDDDDFQVKFRISYLVLFFLLLTLNR